ncbi:MAG: tetratricopeptide repeat protein [Parvibaculales bacterium]
MKKTIQLFAIMGLASGLLVAPVFSPFPETGSAYAQEKEKKQKPKTRRSQTLSKSSGSKILNAQEALANGDHETAMRILQDVLASTKAKPYDKGVAQQFMASVWADKGDYKRAAQEFERAINMNVLPDNVINDITFNLAQLYLAEDQTNKALRLLNKWFKTAKDPGSSAYALRSQIYLIKEDLKRAERDIDIAISKVEEPREAWYRIKLSILLQQDRYKESLPLLEMVVDKFPGKKQYWQQLGAVYFELGKEKEAFSAQQSMYRQGMLTSSKEKVTLAQLYLYNDYPYKAAKILADGLKDKSIERTEKNWELLANSWMHAREWKKSRKPLLNAANKSKTGKHFIQLGQAYIQDEDWGQAEKYLKKGLDKGKLKKREAESWLTLGITQSKLEKYEEAIKTFRKAGDFDDVATDAFRWIRSLERRLAKLKEEKQNAEKKS